MSKIWTGSEYQAAFTDTENPAGLVPLDDDELAGTAGGVVPLTLVFACATTIYCQ